jgi:hypothetical protein
MPFLRRPHHYEADGFPAPTVESLLFSRQRLADTGLALSLGFVLFHPATDRAHPDVHRLADVRNAGALFYDHSNDLELEAGIEITALPGHVNSVESELSSYRGVRGH